MDNFWRGRRVLITGISGFVGSNLTCALMDAGADVVGLDLARTSPSLQVLGAGDVPVLVRDVRNVDRVRWAMEHGNGELGWRSPEIVFHLAGMSHIRQCQEHPEHAWRSNVAGTWNVLEACRNLPQGQIRAVVCASSNHVFGSLPKASVPTCALGHRAYPAIKRDSSRAAWLEDDPCGQSDVYGTSKGCVDLIARAYGAMGLPVAALRHVNAFGPGDPYRSHLVTGVICDLLEGKPPTIRSDGTPLKAYVHVSDICRAYLRIAEALADREIAPGSAVHVATAPIPVLSLVDALIQIAGVDLVPDIRGEDLSQSGYVEILDDSRLRSLGWSPRPLHEGLAETYTWYKARGGMIWSAIK